MALNNIDAKLKKLRLMGGKIAPLTEDVLTHLVVQSRMQACEGLLIAEDLAKLESRLANLEAGRKTEKKDSAEMDALKADFKKLKHDNRLFFFVIVVAWLAIGCMLGALAHYG